LKSGSLNLLEPSEPVQACNGIALPFTMVLVALEKFAPSHAYAGMEGKWWYIILNMFPFLLLVSHIVTILTRHRDAHHLLISTAEIK